jgi:hypothetical protein
MSEGEFIPYLPPPEKIVELFDKIDQGIALGIDLLWLFLCVMPLGIGRQCRKLCPHLGTLSSPQIFIRKFVNRDMGWCGWDVN